MSVEHPPVPGGIEPTASRPASVRPATPGDEPALARLRDQSFAAMAPARGGNMYLQRHAVELPQLRANWADTDRRVWVGGLEHEVVGYLFGTVTTLPSDARLGVIEGIYVEPQARGCGVGEALISVALDWFRAEHCVGVEATALPGQRATKNFFEEHGLKARLLTVYRALDVRDDDQGGS